MLSIFEYHKLIYLTLFVFRQGMVGLFAGILPYFKGIRCRELLQLLPLMCISYITVTHIDSSRLQ